VRPAEAVRSRRVLAAALVAGALIAGLAVSRLTGGSAQTLAWTDLTAKVGPVEFGGSQQHLFRKQVDLARYLSLAETGATIRIPQVDFTREEVALFAVGPRSSAGYSLAVRSVRAEGGTTVVTIDERSPALGSSAPARLTFPFVLIAFARSDRPLRVDWPQRP
jgi:hypothetical protein